MPKRNFLDWSLQGPGDLPYAGNLLDAAGNQIEDWVSKANLATGEVTVEDRTAAYPHGVPQVDENNNLKTKVLKFPAPLKYVSQEGEVWEPEDAKA